ncbi:hypothetical protein V8F20_003423 [Naviculisporaceae sp. PSN 640]
MNTNTNACTGADTSTMGPDYIFAMLIISNLPRGTSRKILLDSAPFEGGVCDLMMIPPQNTFHTSGHAVLLMWTVEGARQVFVHINNGRLAIEGRPLRLTRSGGEKGDRSRVLVVSGQYLENGLISAAHLQSTEVIPRAKGYDGNQETVIWTFLSFNEAKQANRILEGFGSSSRVKSVRYGVDPVDVGVVTASFMNRLAGEQSQNEAIITEDHLREATKEGRKRAAPGA